MHDAFIINEWHNTRLYVLLGGLHHHVSIEPTW